MSARKHRRRLERRAAQAGAWLPVVVVALAAGCSSVPRGGYYEDDGPPARPAVDIAEIPDAVPRAEPPSRHGNAPYTVFGVRYAPRATANGYRERGIASWYGRKFHGRRTSSGEPYDMYAMSAAHRTLPLPSYVRVRNLENGRTVVVRVNDRGPFLHNRLIDLSYAAAARLGMLGTGTAAVEVRAVGPDTPETMRAREREAAGSPVSAAQAADGETAPRLSVQVGAFRRYEHAVELRDRLARAGFGPVYIQSAEPGSTGRARPLYRVRIGPVATVERGDRLVGEVGRYGIPDALLVVD